MRNILLLLIILLSVIGVAQAENLPPAELWSANDSNSSILTNLVSSNHLYANGDPQLLTTGCMDNYTNCIYLDGAGDYYDNANVTIVDGNPYTFLKVFKPDGSEANFDLYGGINEGIYQAQSGGDILASLREGSGAFKNVIAITNYSTGNDTYYIVWARADGVSLYSAYVDNGTYVANTTYDGDYSTNSNYQEGCRAGVACTASTLTLSAIFNQSLTESQMDEITAQILVGDLNWSEAIPVVNQTYTFPSVNLTFDNQSEPFRDYAGANHTFTNTSVGGTTTQTISPPGFSHAVDTSFSYYVALQYSDNDGNGTPCGGFCSFWDVQIPYTITTPN